MDSSLYTLVHSRNRALLGFQKPMQIASNYYPPQGHCYPNFKQLRLFLCAFKLRMNGNHAAHPLLFLAPSDQHNVCEFHPWPWGLACSCTSFIFIPGWFSILWKFHHLSNLDSEPTRNWFLCMKWGRNQDWFFKYGYHLTRHNLLKRLFFSIHLKWYLYQTSDFHMWLVCL